MNPLDIRDNGSSLAGLYGIANNQIAAWLLSRGQGELLALRPAELREGMTAPRCIAPSEKHEYNAKTKRWHWLLYKVSRCGETMRYRPTGWTCYEHKEPKRQPIGMKLQLAPKLIDYGSGPETFAGGLYELLEMAGKTVDMQYRADEPGGRASWRYVVSA